MAPSDQLLTTQEGSSFLGVSRPTFVKTLEAGEIPISMFEKGCRITLEDLTAPV